MKIHAHKKAKSERRVPIATRVVAGLMAVVVALMLAPMNSAQAQSDLISLADLNAAEALWDANGPDAYQYSGEQFDGSGTPAVSAVYTVENDKVTRITHPGNVPAPISSGLTVDEMFDEIRAVVASGSPISAEFDPSDGHPVIYFLPSPSLIGFPNGYVVHGVLPTTTPVLCGKYPATMFGTPGNDVLQGTVYDDVIVGLAGDDELTGGPGEDYLCGGAGEDRIVGDVAGTSGPDGAPNGAPSNDLLYGGPGNDNLDGGWGDDLMYGQGGNDIMNGMAGDDILYGQHGADGMSGGYGEDRLIGGPGYDRIFGSFGNDWIVGAGGNDRLWGEEGDDTIFGKSGDDILHGGVGDDVLFGANGNDTSYGGEGNDRLLGSRGSDTLFGGAGNDIAYGQNDDDWLYGGDGIDVLYGAAGNDTLDGGPGADNLQGANGDDALLGGGGNDALFGQAGNDSFEGGDGNNSCFQGAGSGLRIDCDTTPVDIDGVWTLTSGTFEGQPIGVISPVDARTTLTITGDSITGFRDCNTYVGPVFRNGATFIAGALKSTLIGCAANTGGDYFGALDDVFTVELDTSATPTQLTLIGRNATLVFSPS